MHQVGLRERPSALGAGQNCLDRDLLTHWVSSLVYKVALSLMQAVSRAKDYFLAEDRDPHDAAGYRSDIAL